VRSVVVGRIAASGLRSRSAALRRSSGTLVADTVGTLGLNVSAVALNFVVVLLLTHVLGTVEYGAYASAFAWAGILSVIAVLGLAPLVVRDVAAYTASESWALVRGLIRWTNRAIVASSSATIAGAALVGWLLYRHRAELFHPYLVGLALIPLIALTSLRQAAMQGLGRVVLGRFPETMLTPAVFIAILVGADALVSRRLTAAWAIGFQVGATLAGFALGARLLRRSLPSAVHASAPMFASRSWRRSTVSLLALNVVMAANAQVGTIMLAAVSGGRDAAVFNVAFRVTIFISFILLASSYPLGPIVARLHAAGERLEIERVVVRAARLVLLVSIPIALVLVVFAPTVLGLFGHDFSHGATTVRILAIGDVVNVLTGYGGLVLVMSGRESDLARSIALGAVLNLGLAAALIPPLGVSGAGIAAAASLAVSNVVMTWYAWRKLGIWTGIAGRLA
jgi:O-antigen/teichoic acid export membrane protein